MRFRPRAITINCRIQHKHRRLAGRLRAPWDPPPASRLHGESKVRICEILGRLEFHDGRLGLPKGVECVKRRLEELVRLLSANRRKRE